MRTLDVERLAEGLWEQSGLFADAVDGADPDGRVDTCPEWRIRDLVVHLGQAHRWAAGVARTGAPAPAPDPGAADPGGPDAWSGWLRAGAQELIEAVGDGGTVVWTFTGPRPSVFWLRRMLHDTSVHQGDAALALGTAFEIAPDLAADAITEGLELLTAPGAEAIKSDLAELRGDGQTLQVLPADGPEGWLITRTPGGPRWEHGSSGGDVVVAGPVAGLLLVLTRRLPADGSGARVTGDRALLDHWLAHTAM
ncbi:maleylpyruvate isomerase family mycothiol-dependent enzyme [Spirillospora sp. NBC_01491]|uniref:maleylpyruvate isomerase family mycothiol-dependent enzyme n=1 Tax=Spirillospora sp. NBC_01491 TaxID=2976007 RepID=UPI002E2EE100|nr:maleylpyruvate isomerase family mycothiol-dependent enzyme [Spirillospora sp. NBC_01491]